MQPNSFCALKIKRMSPRKKEKEEEEEKEAEVLPSELIIEVLLRLPVKSVIRFKSVCKSWYYLISDPQFANSHFELDAAGRTKRLAYFGIEESVPCSPAIPQARSIDFNASLHDDSACSVLNCESLGYWEVIEVVGSCRGFLLLVLDECLCVWNPSTGVNRHIDWSPSELEEVMDCGERVCMKLGLGYDSLTDDYMVFLLFYDETPELYTHLEYFSFRENVWIKVEGTNLTHSDDGFYNGNTDVGMFLNGAMHWLAYNIVEELPVVLVYDLTERDFSDIDLPADFDISLYHCCVLMEVGELLNVCAHGRNHSVEIWAMKEYKVKSSWTKTFILSVDGFLAPSFSPVCYTDSGYVVGKAWRTGLVKCNDKGHVEGHMSYFNFNLNEISMAVYTESLLSLPGNEGDQQPRRDLGWGSCSEDDQQPCMKRIRCN